MSDDQFTLIEDEDRISAVDPSGIEICGAYRPLGHSHWLLYLTTLTTRLTGVRVGHNACFYDHGDGRARSDAKSWVQTIADLYSHAVPAPAMRLAATR